MSQNVEIIRRGLEGVRVHQRAVGSASGAPVEADFWFLHMLRDQHVVRLDIYPQKAQALEAAGLQE